MIYKKIKNKIIAILSILLILSLSACANKTETGTNDTQTKIVRSEGKKILIVYFAVAENSEVDAISSASVREVNGEAKGNVRILADTIQSQVGGDFFSIETEEDYPGELKTLVDFAEEEQKANGRPKLLSHIENLDDYDTIFIGYPNWWYDLPMPLYSFFEEYDLSGKNIIPFCTHDGSEFSSTIDTIKELEPDAAIVKGLAVNHKNVLKAKDDVTKWLGEMGMKE
ncbi:flavodoxin [Clostridium beijerinckii]|nr:flavodoxin [Clostridium beijerinckii]